MCIYIAYHSTTYLSLFSLLHMWHYNQLGYSHTVAINKPCIYAWLEVSICVYTVHPHGSNYKQKGYSLSLCLASSLFACVCECSSSIFKRHTLNSTLETSENQREKKINRKGTRIFFFNTFHLFMSLNTQWKFSMEKIEHLQKLELLKIQRSNDLALFCMVGFLSFFFSHSTAPSHFCHFC